MTSHMLMGLTLVVTLLGLTMAYMIVLPPQWVKKKILEPAIQNTIRLWLQAVAAKDMHALLGLYEEDASLLPTLGVAIRQTPAERAAYFRDFLRREGLHGRVVGMTVHGNLLSATAVGDYIFLYTEDGREHRVPARFSFTMRPQWLHGRLGFFIQVHHSSACPSVLQEAGVSFHHLGEPLPIPCILQDETAPAGEAWQPLQAAAE